MTRAMQIRLKLSDPRRVAELLGLERSREERKKWRCPRHGGTSLSLTVGRDRTLQAACFGCDLAGDLFTLLAELNPGHDFPALLALGGELAGLGPEETAERAHVEPLPPPPPPEWAPREEVERLWWYAASGDLWAHREAAAYLASRGLDPRTVGAYGLARVLPADAAARYSSTARPYEARPEWDDGGAHPWPAWAVCGRPWYASGHRLLVPTYDARGDLRGVRAWRPGSAAPKRVAPKGYSSKGLVLADLFGQALLRGEGPVRRVIVVEGEPDALSVATAYGLLDADRPAVLGVEAGAWTHEIAGRVKGGADVRIATHPDAAGDRYAEQIASTLAWRCTVSRIDLGGERESWT